VIRQNHASVERIFSQSDFDRFARLSGDENPIHVDPEFSSGTRFGRTVAHGLLLCSVLRGLIEQLAPGAHILEQSVMFPDPTFAGESVRFSATVMEAGEKSASVELEVMRIDDEQVTCQGNARLAL